MDEPSNKPPGAEPSKPSGAFWRKQRRAAEKASAALRRKSRDEHPTPYSSLGLPPLDDPTAALVYAQNALLMALHEVLNDPGLTPEQRWRFITDMTAKIGMTHAKALVQSRISKAVKRLEGVEDKGGEDVEPFNGTVDPAGAGDRDRGEYGDAVSGLMLGPETGED